MSDSIIYEDEMKFDNARFYQFPFGKYKGKTLQSVLAEDPKYIYWCIGQDMKDLQFSIAFTIFIQNKKVQEKIYA